MSAAIAARRSTPTGPSSSSVRGSAACAALRRCATSGTSGPSRSSATSRDAALRPPAAHQAAPRGDVGRDAHLARDRRRPRRACASTSSPGSTAAALDVEGRVGHARGRPRARRRRRRARDRRARRGGCPAPRARAGVHVVRTLAQSIALRDELARLGPGGRVVVVGARVHRRGGRVDGGCARRCASRSSRLSRSRSRPIVGDARGRVADRAAPPRGDRGPRGCRRSTRWCRADRGRGRPSCSRGASGVDADVVVVGIGVRPATDVARRHRPRRSTTAWSPTPSLFAPTASSRVGDLARFDWHHGGIATSRSASSTGRSPPSSARPRRTSLVAGRDAAPPVVARAVLLERPARTQDPDARPSLGHRRGGRTSRARSTRPSSRSSTTARVGSRASSGSRAPQRDALPCARRRGRADRRRARAVRVSSFDRTSRT